MNGGGFHSASIAAASSSSPVSDDQLVVDRQQLRHVPRERGAGGMRDPAGRRHHPPSTSARYAGHVSRNSACQRSPGRSSSTTTKRERARLRPRRGRGVEPAPPLRRDEPSPVGGLVARGVRRAGGEERPGRRRHPAAPAVGSVRRRIAGRPFRFSIVVRHPGQSTRAPSGERAVGGASSAPCGAGSGPALRDDGALECGARRRRAADRLQYHAVALGQLQQAWRAARRPHRCRARSRSRIARKPTGASRSTPSVPRTSRSPSAWTVPPATAISSAVATARSVTPAQATSASSSMSPEQASSPVPPVDGCSPASTSARPVSTRQAMPVGIERARRAQRDHGGARALAVALLERRLQRRAARRRSCGASLSGVDEQDLHGPRLAAWSVRQRRGSCRLG